MFNISKLQSSWLANKHTNKNVKHFKITINWVSNREKDLKKKTLNISKCQSTGSQVQCSLSRMEEEEEMVVGESITGVIGL